MINVVIMVLGFVRRMGVNKFLLNYKGCFIIEYVFREVSKIDFY